MRDRYHTYDLAQSRNLLKMACVHMSARGRRRKRHGSVVGGPAAPGPTGHHPLAGPEPPGTKLTRDAVAAPPNAPRDTLRAPPSPSGCAATPPGSAHPLAPPPTRRAEDAPRGPPTFLGSQSRMMVVPGSPPDQDASTPDGYPLLAGSGRWRSPHPAREGPPEGPAQVAAQVASRVTQRRSQMRATKSKSM